jgi:hypothetical protein
MVPSSQAQPRKRRPTAQPLRRYVKLLQRRAHSSAAQSEIAGIESETLC